jgi:hypothetical protein
VKKPNFPFKDLPAIQDDGLSGMHAQCSLKPDGSGAVMIFGLKNLRSPKEPHPDIE